MLGLGGAAEKASFPKPSSSGGTPPPKKRKLLKEGRYGERRVLRSLGIAKDPPSSPTKLKSSYSEMASKMTELVRAVLRMGGEHDRSMAMESGGSLNSLVPPSL